MKGLRRFVSFCYFLPFQLLCMESTIGASLFDHSSSMARIQNVEVKCLQSGMTVIIEFDQPFHGIIYSKGHFYDSKCRYSNPQTTGRRSFTFQIPAGACGTEGNLRSSREKDEIFFENTIIFQNDPLIQEIWDQARRLKCTWHETFSKNITIKAPFAVQEPQKVDLQFDARSLNTLMEIQRGRSPFSSPATGYIVSGEDSSIIIYVQETGLQNLDANVVSCKASNSGGESVSLVDAGGCLLRPDLMSPFSKTKHPNNVEADLAFVSHLRAFRVGENVAFTVSCQLEVCEERCLEPCALGPLDRRRKRDVPEVEASNDPNKRLLDLQSSVIVLSKAFEDEAKSDCGLSEIAALVIALMVVLLAAMTALISFLLLKIFNLQKQMYK